MTLAKFFVELARKDMDLASDVIATFIKEDRKRVTRETLIAEMPELPFKKKILNDPPVEQVFVIKEIFS